MKPNASVLHLQKLTKSVEVVFRQYFMVLSWSHRLKQYFIRATAGQKFDVFALQHTYAKASKFTCNDFRRTSDPLKENWQLI